MVCDTRFNELLKVPSCTTGYGQRVRGHRSPTGPYPSDDRSQTILLTGATGYVGGRLAPRAARRRPPRPLPRARPRQAPTCPTAPRSSRATSSPAQGLDEALQGADVAYYLVHSMGGGSGDDDFAERDRRAAAHFGEAAAARRRRRASSTSAAWRRRRRAAPSTCAAATRSPTSCAEHVARARPRARRDGHRRRAARRSRCCATWSSACR